jgi:hypothetical protein
MSTTSEIASVAVADSRFDYKLISSNTNSKARLIEVPNVVAVNSKTRNRVLKQSKPSSCRILLAYAPI